MAVKTCCFIVALITFSLAFPDCAFAETPSVSETQTTAAQWMKLAARARLHLDPDEREKLSSDPYAVAAARDLMHRAHGQIQEIPSILPYLKDPDINVYLNAAMLLDAIGSGAIAVVPEIMQAADSHPSFFAIRTGVHPVKRLNIIRSEVAAQGGTNEILESFLSHSHAYVQIWALETIKEMGAGGRTYSTRLLAMLDEPPSTVADVREACFAALAATAAPDVALPRLIQDLDGPSPSAAMNALDDMGPEAVAALRVALSSDKSRVRWAAASCLRYMMPHSSSATEDLADLLDDPDPKCRLAAAEAVWHISGRAALVAPALVSAASEGSERWHALNTFKELSSDTSIEAIDALAQALSTSDSEFRAAAADCLGRMGPASRQALPQLRKLLEDEDPQARFAAARAVWCLDHEPTEVLPVLTGILESGETSGDILALVEELDEDALPLLPHLVAVVKSQSHSRIKAAQVLGNWGTKAAPAIDGLKSSLQEKNGSVLAAVALALHQIDPKSEDSAVALSDYLARLPSRPDQNIYSAFQAVQKLGPDAAPAIPTLVAAFQHERWAKHSIDALQRVGSNALPALEEAAASDNVEVQVHARQAIKRIKSSR